MVYTKHTKTSYILPLQECFWARTPDKGETRSCLRTLIKKREKRMTTLPHSKVTSILTNGMFYCHHKISNLTLLFTKINNCIQFKPRKLQNTNKSCIYDNSSDKDGISLVNSASKMRYL